MFNVNEVLECNGARKGNVKRTRSTMAAELMNSIAPSCRPYLSDCTALALPMPRAYGPYTLLSAQLFRLDAREYREESIDQRGYYPGPMVIMAENRATGKELPCVNGKPTLAAMARATRYASESEAVSAQSAMESKYGANWAFVLVSSRCLDGTVYGD